jgi:nucleoside-diphosphate-sugar epimerase
MRIHLFGVATPSGNALRQLAKDELVGYTRKVSSATGWLHPADLNDPELFHPACLSDAPSIWISFAPIWLLAPFLHQLATHHPERLRGLRGVIATSSSSSVTKRFASNRFDRQLVSRLIAAEELMLATCRGLTIHSYILRPTLIYGRVGEYGDKNLSRVLQLLRRLPLLPLPSETGLRQPIHASQLAAVALRLAQQVTVNNLDPLLSERIALGGDTTVTYNEMIRALQQAQTFKDPARRCHLLPIPNRLFFLIASPLLLCSPKAFEAVLRMGADLSDFTPAHQLLGTEPQIFPVLPLA